MSTHVRSSIALTQFICDLAYASLTHAGPSVLFHKHHIGKVLLTGEQIFDITFTILFHKPNFVLDIFPVGISRFTYYISFERMCLTGKNVRGFISFFVVTMEQTWNILDLSVTDPIYLIKTWSYTSHEVDHCIGSNARKLAFGGLRITKEQTSLRIRAV